MLSFDPTRGVMAMTTALLVFAILNLVAVLPQAIESIVNLRERRRQGRARRQRGRIEEDVRVRARLRLIRR